VSKKTGFTELAVTKYRIANLSQENIPHSNLKLASVQFSDERMTVT
jgi:hypothetical protein